MIYDIKEDMFLLLPDADSDSSAARFILHSVKNGVFDEPLIRIGIRVSLSECGGKVKVVGEEV